MQLFDPRPIRAADDIGRDQQIVLQEFHRHRVVGENAADFRRREKNRLRFSILQETMRRRLVAQIKLLARRGDDLAIFGLQPANDGGTRHAAMAGDVNAFAFEIVSAARAHSVTRDYAARNSSSHSASR